MTAVTVTATVAVTAVTVTVTLWTESEEIEEDECNAVITITSQSSDRSSAQFLVTIRMLWPRGKIQNIDSSGRSLFQPVQSNHDCVSIFEDPI